MGTLQVCCSLQLRRADTPRVPDIYAGNVARYGSPRAILAQAIRAILLARAMAATFTDRRSMHRHRIAPDIALRLATEITDGTLRFASALGPGNAPFTFDCRGHLPAWAAIRNPLIARLLGDGIIHPDPLGLGLDVTSERRVIRQDGTAWPNLYAIGPLTRGRFWEIEAIPEIRAQCEATARLFGGEANELRKA